MGLLFHLRFGTEIKFRRPSTVTNNIVRAACLASPLTTRSQYVLTIDQSVPLALPAVAAVCARPPRSEVVFIKWTRYCRLLQRKKPQARAASAWQRGSYSLFSGISRKMFSSKISLHQSTRAILASADLRLPRAVHFARPRGLRNRESLGESN